MFTIINTNFVVDALTCYSCDESDYNYDPSLGCHGFDDTAPTETCDTSSYCLSVYADQNDIDIEFHLCAYNDELEGTMMLNVFLESLKLSPNHLRLGNGFLPRKWEWML